MSGDLNRLTPATARLVRAAAANLPSVDLESPEMTLLSFETVCPDCHLATNRHISICTNCSSRG